jgi:tetratricopeptide (TPR) repeat protein
MRVKLRILPQKRAGLIQPGKNPKYYFLVAARFSLRNEYALAIEYLNKGLALDSTNLLCRFNHGAIAFKLGLIIEATNDFQMISAIYKKELAGHFNYALCLYQQGSYKEAKDTLDLIVNQVKNKN